MKLVEIRTDDHNFPGQPVYIYRTKNTAVWYGLPETILVKRLQPIPDIELDPELLEQISAEEHEYDRRQEMADNARMEALEEKLWEDWEPLYADHL